MKREPSGEVAYGFPEGSQGILCRGNQLDGITKTKDPLTLPDKGGRHW
jgi:hypothetical protein